MLRASTDYTLLPSTLAVSHRNEPEAEVALSCASYSHAPSRSPGEVGAANDTAGTKQQLPKGRHQPTQHEDQQQYRPREDSVAAPPPSSATPEDEEAAAAIGPYLRLKAVLAQGVRIDLAVAE